MLQVTLVKIMSFVLKLLPLSFATFLNVYFVTKDFLSPVKDLRKDQGSAQW